MKKCKIHGAIHPDEVRGEKIKQALGDQCACYVLLTCTEPDRDGKMEVEMNYEGDETLASFLIENASQVFDGRIEQSK